MAFLFLSVDAAFPFLHGGAADKGQGVGNRQNRTGGQMPALPLPTIRKRHTRGNANVKIRILFGLKPNQSGGVCLFCISFLRLAALLKAADSLLCACAEKSSGILQQI